MYAGHRVCYPMVSHSEYANETERQMDGRQTVTLSFLLDAANVIMGPKGRIKENVMFS